MIPVMPKPAPGDVSRGYRIVDARLEGKEYIVALEGRSGTEGSFALKTFDQAVAAIRGGRIVDVRENGVLTFTVAFPESEKTFVNKQIQIVLEG